MSIWKKSSNILTKRGKFGLQLESTAKNQLIKAGSFDKKYKLIINKVS